MNKSLQGKVEYAYKLEGLEENWINIGGDNQVTFRNIPYRNYKLHIKARYKIRNGRLTTQPCSSASILRFGSVGGLN